MVNKSQGKLKMIEKDLLQDMIDNNKWSKQNEKNILKSRDILIGLWLEEGYNVICTDTNQIGRAHV